MPTQAKEYTESELDQIRADAAEQARKATAERCLQISRNWADTWEMQGLEDEIKEEFGL